MINWEMLEKELGGLSKTERKYARSLWKKGYSDQDILEMLLYDREEKDINTPQGTYDYYGIELDNDYVPQSGVKKENVWKADCGFVEPCQRAVAKEITIPMEVWRQIVAMTNNTQTEWLGYLDFTVEGDRIMVTAMTIPEQYATSAEVEPVNPVTGKGVIHAHPGGGTPEFSLTDRETLNPNNEFSIVISRDLMMTAVVKQKLPCGSLSMVPAEVTVEGMEADMSFYEGNKEKIKTRATPTQYNYVDNYLNGIGGYRY